MILLWIQSLQFRNFRNLRDDQASFQQGLNWIVGENGQGKTNCLEAIYFALTSKSFRTTRLADLVNEDQKTNEVRGELVKNDHISRLGVTFEQGKTSRFLFDKVVKSFDYIQTGACIAFTARSKSLVDGAPEDRRRFLDRMICYGQPQHLIRLSKYRKILGQLKRILHTNKDLQVYQSFKTSMIPLAVEVAQARMQFLEDIRKDTLVIYRDVFKGQGDLYFEYKLRNCEVLEKLPQKLGDLSAQEVLYSKSMAGPHLDDLQIRFQDKKASRYASSGQVRAIVLSMKLAVRKAYFDRVGLMPVLLLDDIDAELDTARLDSLLDYLQGPGQVLITTSKYGIVKRRRKGIVFHVEAGRISSERIHE